MTTKSKADGGAKKSGGSALQKPVTPSKELAVVVGAEPMPRTEVNRSMID